MGTTATALQTETGPRYCYVLAIEGWNYLLTDHFDPSAVVTAWAASEWSSCLTGLKVSGQLGGRFDPWQTDLDVRTLRVAVQPDDNDTFGKAVFKAKGTYNTRLASTFQPAADGSGTINVVSTAGFASSGEVHVGGVRHYFGSKTATSFSISAGFANTHSPFSAHGGNRYSPPAVNPAGLNWDTSVAPRVASAPTKWTGRKCALYIHRIVGTTLDTLAQAQLEFAGQIVSVSDSADGETVLELEDLRGRMRDCVILKDQWTGYVKHGIVLKAGTQLWAREFASTASGFFTVVASGASGADEIDEGIYETSEFVSRLDKWLSQDATLSATWSISIATSSDAGQRTVVHTTDTSGGSFGGGGGSLTIDLICSNNWVLEFLGFTKLSQFNDSTGHWFRAQGAQNGDNDIEIVSDRAPYRAKMVQNQAFKQGTRHDLVVQLDTHDGTFYDQRDYLPPGLINKTADGEAWSVFQCGNSVLLARYDSATQLSNMTKWVGPLVHLDERDDPDNDGITFDDEADILPVRQVLILAGSFTDVVTKLMASIPGGTSGVNHATYDVFPWGAGIPWSLLGDNWVNSCLHLEEATNSKSILTLITKPMRLLDLLASELSLRLAWIGWKDEGFQARTLPLPNATTPDFVLDETNKAMAASDIDAGRSITDVTNQFLRNVVDLEYARDAAGKYHRHLFVKDQASITEHGEKQTKIQAVNSFGAEALVASSVEDLATSLVTRVFPRFGKPLWTLRRPIAPTLFHMAPGDTVAVSDDFARDPTSGARGLSSRAGVVFSIDYDRGQHGGKLSGEVEVLFGIEDRTYPLAPAAEVDTSFDGTLDGLTFSKGYAAAGPALKLKDHAYSNSGDALDASRLAAGDLIRIIRMDDGASGDAWSRTIASVDAVDGYVVTTATLSSPSYTAAATAQYRVQYREYSACTNSQRLHAFQADTDGYVEDLAEPNCYAEQQWAAFDNAALSTLPRLKNGSEDSGDGKPVHAGLLHDIAAFLNNLPSYRTAPNMPILNNQPMTWTGATVYGPLLSFPFYLGPAPAAGLVRKLYLAPFFKTSNAANTCTVRVTSSELMPHSDEVAGALLFRGAYNQVSFTTTSTSYVEATPQSLVPARSGTTTWITVEIAASDVSAGKSSMAYGLSRLYLGPVEAA